MVESNRSQSNEAGLRWESLDEGLGRSALLLPQHALDDGFGTLSQRPSPIRLGLRRWSVMMAWSRLAQVSRVVDYAAIEGDGTLTAEMYQTTGQVARITN
jgi:hypothetical protein